jgi:predicted ABC-type ATPase
MPRKSANCYIVAGPNGAGKTTFATEFLPLYANCRNFVNPDLLARAFSPFDPDAGMLRAGRTVLERIEEFTQAKKDFAFETTRSGRGYMPLLRRVNNPRSKLRGIPEC